MKRILIVKKGEGYIVCQNGNVTLDMLQVATTIAYCLDVIGDRFREVQVDSEEGKKLRVQIVGHKF